MQPPVRTPAELSAGLLPALAALRGRLPRAPTAHRATRNPGTTLDTLWYVMRTARKGTLVVIRGGAVRLFVPLENSEYVNRWSDRLAPGWVAPPPPPQGAPFRDLPDPARWYMNAGAHLDSWDGTASAPDPRSARYYAFLVELCRAREVPDVEFILNLRDAPLLRRDRREPAVACWPPGAAPRVLDPRARYAPILSFFTDADHEDVPIPSLDDIAAAGKPRCAARWADKADVVLWRGAATGAGVTPATNPRLRVAALRDADFDVGCVSRNARERVVCDARDGSLRLVLPDPAGLPALVPRVEEAAQRAFRYILYIDGNAAAARYSAMMRMGVVIFRVTSEAPGGHLWFFDRLTGTGDDPDHLVIAADLSNLRATLDWCRANPEAAGRIAAAAAERAPSLDDIYDYMLRVLREVDFSEFPPGYEYGPESEPVAALARGL